MNYVNIVGLRIANIDLYETIKIIEQTLREKSKHLAIFTPNSNFVVKANRDANFLAILNQADILIPDGMPLIWASKFLNTPLKEKVSGSSLFFSICELAARCGYSLYFLGGDQGVAEKAAFELKKKYHKINIVGTYYAPFGFEYDDSENQKILGDINSKKPEILIIGLGAGQGERWIIKHKKEYPAFLSIQLGASFSFAAGITKMPPEWIKRNGFGWLWRLLNEPRRLWKRYLLQDIKIFYYIFQQKYLKRT
ncbi:MAG: WecB/TagA/CpsF family glycosyltransferase [Ignavibacteria bacterium]|nr:WecB/TagA/CpsF family glycosyltransferase [Ignavibacteria bacterium]